MESLAAKIGCSTQTLTGSADLRYSLADAMARHRPTQISLRRSKGKTRSSSERMRSCGRPRAILPRRSSTADLAKNGFHCRVFSHWGVEPIGREIQLAPSQYYKAKARERDEDLAPDRHFNDRALTAMIHAVHERSNGLYGARKVWHTLDRSSVAAARFTVERLMRSEGVQGARCGRRWKTTVPDESADRPLDLVERQFTAEDPNRLWVAGFTNVPA